MTRKGRFWRTRYFQVLVGIALGILVGFTSGQIVHVLIVAILFGIALALLGERGERVLGAMRVLAAIVFRIAESDALRIEGRSDIA